MIFRINFLFFCLISLNFNIGLSQNSISTISSSTSCHGSCTIFGSNGEYFVGGTKGGVSFISKMNSSNNIVWSKDLSTNYGGQTRSTITTFRLHGDTIYGVGQSEGSAVANTDGAFVFKMDANNGNLYWFKGEITSNMYFSDIMIDGSNYIISGAGNTGGANSNCNYLAVSAANGNIVWQTNRFDLEFASTGYNHIDDVLATTEVHDGYFYATGRLYLNSGNAMRAFVQKLSASGQIIWSKYLLFPENSSPSVRFYGRDIEFIENEGNIIVGVAGDPNSVSTDWRMGLIKIDTSGTVLWAKQYNHPSPSEDLRYVEVIDNGFRVVGQTNQYSTTGKNLVVFETNFSGNLTLSKEIAKTGFNCLILHPDFNNLPGESSHNGNQTITPFSIRNTSGAPQLNQLVILKINDLNQLNSSCFNVTTPILTESNITPFSGNLLKIETTLNTIFNQVATANPTLFNASCANESHQISVSINTCQSATLSTNVTAPYQILWSTGSTNSQITATASGSYSVEIFNPSTCCYYYDTVLVNLVPSETLTIQMPDTISQCSSSGINYLIDPIVTYTGGQNLNYVWSNMTTATTLQVTAVGWYYLTVDDGCNTALDSIFITQLPEPIISGNTQYDLCAGDQITISNSISNATSITWSTGATTPTLSISTPGNYYQTAINSCGEDTLFFDVTLILDPVGFLPPDFDTCTVLNSVEIEYTSTSPGNLLWNTGETTPTITISNSGYYWVSSSNSCTTIIDSVLVNIITPPLISGDTIFDYCLKQSVTVSHNVQNATSQSWSTGETNSSITINQPGTYYHTASNNCGTDTLFFEVFEIPIPTGTITDSIDTCLLNGEPITLTFNPSFPFSILWSTGETNNSIMVNEPGNYFLEAFNECATIPFTVSVQIDALEPLFSLPESFIFCISSFGDVALMPTYPMTNLDDFDYLWSNGASTPNQMINQSGIYWLTMSNLCGEFSDTTEVVIENKPIASFQVNPIVGCSPLEITIENTSTDANSYEWSIGQLDTVTNSQQTFSSILINSSIIELIATNDFCSDTSYFEINVNQCGCTDPYAVNFDSTSNYDDGSCIYLDLVVEVPNVFTPTGDNANEGYHLITQNASKIEYSIINRWGNLMFVGSGINPIWDGKNESGILANDGVYFITYKVWGLPTENSDIEMIEGHSYLHLVK